MRKIRLLASDGEALLGQVPSSWADVPVGTYAPLAAADGLPAKIEALAALVSLPAEPLLDNPELAGEVLALAPWLFAGPLPGAAEPAASFTHLGTTYVATGGVEQANAAQLEALLTLVQEQGTDPLAAAPGLLAVLYVPEGQAQSPETYARTAEALASLPMSVAYPALLDFTRRSAPWVLATQRYSAARVASEQALSALEQALTFPTSGPRGSSWSMQRWLGKAWLKHARKLLPTSSPPSAFTAGLTATNSTR